jgi:type IV pilus assembly protein PilA
VKNDEPKSGNSKDPTMTIVAVIVFVLLLAAIGLTQFVRQRARSEDIATGSNLRQIAQGAELFFIKQGVSSVASATLVGTNSSQYLKTFATVANETYTRVILQGNVITASGIAGARTITFGP